jgi:hypothetical protein
VEANPTLAISGTTVTCSGQTTTLTASGASTYTWSIGTQSAFAVVSPTISTTYTVIGINTNNGCFSSAIQNVSVNTLPLISAPSGTICTGASFVINPSGASTYSYAGGSATVSPTANTSYTVSGISAAGCAGANIATVNVFVNPLPLVVVSGATAVCAGESLTLNASGASSYVWSNSASGNSITVSPAVATVYSVIGTDANNCSANASISIVVNTLPTITVASGAICPGNSFTLTPSGAISYTYSGGTDIVSPQTTTNYSISGTSADGCVSALPAVATVSVVNTLTVTISGNSTICEGDTLYLTANGASNYLWDSGFTTNTIAVSPQANATYSVLGVSGTCTNSASFSVLVNPAPLISVNSGSICLGNTFTFNPTGAVSYTFSSGSVTVSPLVNSVYTVSGTDTNNCSAANTATVSVLALPILSVTSSQADFMCEGVTALLTVSGASTYTWNLGVTNSTIAIMPTSTTLYSVSGTDANGCKNSVAFIQNVDPCLGIAQKKQNSNDFLLYPNPNTGHFYVELTDNINSLTIENLEGKTLYTLQITKHENKTEINVPLLQPGIYFCKVQTNDSLIIKKLIISQ